MRDEFEMMDGETIEEFKIRVGICAKDDGIKLDELELDEEVEF